MKDRVYYEKQFAGYADVVTLEELRAMLGGIGYKTAVNLIRNNEINCLFARNRYFIPKTSVIDFLVSESYDLLIQRSHINRSNNTDYKKLIVSYLSQHGKGKKADFNNLLFDKLPDYMTDIQKQHKVSKLLAALKSEEIIKTDSPNQQRSHWVLIK